MREDSLIIVFSPDLQYVLMIDKKRGPYPGKLNFVGGAINLCEDNGIHDCAVRELREETSISRNVLRYLCTISKSSGDSIAVYATVAEKRDAVAMTDEELVWEEVWSVLDSSNEAIAGEGEIAYFTRLALHKMGGSLYGAN